MKRSIPRVLSLKAACIVGASLCIGAAAGWAAERYFYPPASYRGSALFENPDGYDLIDPLLACDVGAQDTFPELDATKAAVNKVVADAKGSGKADQVSVYVRRLRSARWFDINPTASYTPASLFKVFVLLAFYKEADSDNPAVLQRTVAFEGSSTTTTDIAGKEIPRLIPGERYTIDRLIDQMIVYSDNDAATTLVDNFDPKTWDAFNALFTNLQIPSPAKQESALLPMSVDQYAMVFRVLYGATYMSDAYSERALKLLSETTYSDGIAAGVPSGVLIAHKYGDAVSPSIELHDCGIVYFPSHPYLLCVMTSGKDFSSLQSVIQDVSKAVYSEAESSFKK